MPGVLGGQAERPQVVGDHVRRFPEVHLRGGGQVQDAPEPFGGLLRIPARERHVVERFGGLRGAECGRGPHLLGDRVQFLHRFGAGLGVGLDHGHRRCVVLSDAHGAPDEILERVDGLADALGGEVLEFFLDVFQPGFDLVGHFVLDFAQRVLELLQPAALRPVGAVAQAVELVGEVVGLLRGVPVLLLQFCEFRA